MKMGLGLYVKNSAEAVEVYKEAFGLELGYHVLRPDGGYFHSELCKDGQELFDIIESPWEDPGDNIVQVSALLDSEDEVRHAFALLSPGGRVETPVGPLPWSPCAASVFDRFGVWWYLTAPQHHPADDWTPEL